jgi:Protein of unknown function (DUF4238)
MAEHKNQHFVPRVLLRPFTDRREGKSVNLYNIKSNRPIATAPVKGQCARHYWYGEDGVLEDLLSKIEGLFAKNRDRVIAGSNDESERRELRRFMYFQHWRTKKAADRLRHSYEQMNANSWAPDEPIPDYKKLVLRSMRFGLQSRDFVDDLKVRIVENRSKTDFVICDDPAVMLNRFTVERLDDAAFGVSSSGLIIVMPLTPRLSMICYDGQVYTLNVTDGRLLIKNDAAADAFNDIQMLATSENIYFRDWAQREYVQRRFLACKDKRPFAYSTVKTFVPDGEDNHTEHYRPGTVDEGRTAKRSLIAVRFNHPQPERWIPGLRYRDKPKTFYNGTGVGHVRKREWLRGLPMPRAAPFGYSEADRRTRIRRGRDDTASGSQR